MIGFATVGVSSLEVSGKFYDSIFSIIGVKLLWENDRAIMFGEKKDQGTFCLILPFNKESSSPGNGNMVAIKAISTEKVDLLHQKSIELGGLDEGAPGKRDVTFYGAYVRDLDGNKLCFYCRT
tara:strand:+ start:264 stop:632 length:369 start_codon:yes stop_codon:yes gene_type:complete